MTNRPHKTWLAASLIVMGAALPHAGEAQDQPLSAIDWLQQTPQITANPGHVQSVVRVPTVEQDTDIAEDVDIPDVETALLDGPDDTAVGLINPTRVGLPSALWQASKADDLIELIHDTDLSVPTMSRLMQMLLLAEAPGPAGNGSAFLAARLERLIAIGAVDSAQAILERAGIENPAIFAQWSELALLTGHSTQMCRTLTMRPELSLDVTLKIYCIAQSGDWTRAATLLQSSVILGDIRPRQARLMAQFLDPELAESQPIPLPPVRPSALTYRIYEAIGDPLPSLGLPLPFATLDLSGDNGWKPQLEAAERLARAGALPPNQLLGVYSLRRPAASGGIWDRVDAFQKFETTLDHGPDSRIQSSLLAVWPQMANTGLAVPFSELFADRLADKNLTGRADRIVRRMAFLSPEYETLGPSRANDSVQDRFLTAIATGAEPVAPYPDMPHAIAVARAFGNHPAPSSVVDHVNRGQLGQAILEAMALFAAGGDGKSSALTDGLSALRALGMEGFARRAALELMILDAEHARR